MLVSLLILGIYYFVGYSIFHYYLNALINLIYLA